MKLIADARHLVCRHAEQRHVAGELITAKAAQQLDVQFLFLQNGEVCVEGQPAHEGFDRAV